MKDKFAHFFRLGRQLYIKRPFDTLICYVKAHYWGVEIGNKNIFIGTLKIRKTPGSRIRFGSGIKILSSFSSNLHGLNRKSMLSTLKPNAQLLIGDNVGMSGCVICASNYVEIKDRVMIGANCTITDTDSHSIFYKERHPDYFNINTVNFKEQVKTKQIIIEEDVFIGMHSLVLKGSHIGKGSVIAAGSIVTGYIPEGVIAAGQPARVIKKIE